MAEYPTEVIFEDKAIQDFFKNITKKLKNVENGEKKYSAILSVHVFADIIDHFRKEQGSEGAWKPWSPNYKKYAESMGRKKMLQWSGNLRNNFGKTAQEFNDTRLRTTKNTFTWFNNAKVGKDEFPYAAAHDAGGPILPKRDFMWLSDKAAEKMASDTLNFILDENI